MIDIVSGFASLPMYDLAQLRGAWDRLWAIARDELRRRGIDADADLQRSEPYAKHWLDSALLLGQTCGWPFVSQLGDAVVPLARFDFGLGTKAPGDYLSWFIAPDDSTGTNLPGPAERIADPAIRIAVNAFDSQSGFRVLGDCLGSPMTLSRNRIVEAGSHLGSIRAVAGGQAQLAAVDAATWQFALDHEPAAQKVRVIGRSRDVPGLPLITSRANRQYAPLLREALGAAIAVLTPADRRQLHLRGLVAAAAGDYEVLRRPPFGNLAAG